MPYATTVVLLGPKKLENYYVFIYTQFFQVTVLGEITDLVVRVIVYVENCRFAAIDCTFETILHERDLFYE